MVLAQPTFTFPSHGNVATQGGISPGAKWIMPKPPLPSPDSPTRDSCQPVARALRPVQPGTVARGHGATEARQSASPATPQAAPCGPNLSWLGILPRSGLDSMPVSASTCSLSQYQHHRCQCCLRMAVAMDLEIHLHWRDTADNEPKRALGCQN